MLNQKTLSFSPAFALLLLLFAGMGSAQLISSQEALTKAKPYLDSTMAPFPRPLMASSDFYYVFAPSIYSPQRIFVVVSEQSGEVEFNEYKLGIIGQSVFDYGVLNEYIVKNKVSFSDMQTTMRQTVTAITRNVDSLSALSSKTQQSYPGTNFDAVEQKALLLQDMSLELDGLVADGVGLQAQFDNDFSDYSLHQLLAYYKNTFSRTETFISAYDDYNNAISLKQTEIFRSSIPAPDNENIVKTLENMRLKADLFENIRFLKPWDNLEKLENGKSQWVNDSVKSLTYKKNSLEITGRFNELKPLVENVLYSEAILAQCGLEREADKVKSEWREVSALKERASSSDLQRLKTKLDALEQDYLALEQAYSQCTNPVYPTSEVDDTSEGFNFLPIVLLIVLAGAGYMVWKYKKSQEETYQ